MNKFYNSKFFNSAYLYLLIIVIYSFCINFYYGNLGVYPIDTFLHYDSAYRILKKEFPIKDYWIVSGFIIEFIQSIFFKVLGINWFAYIFHSSLINLITSVIVFYFFLDLKLNSLRAFVYTLSFSTLAYTFSGTPFVDHHASFFLMIATFMMIKLISDPYNKTYLLLIIILSFFSFLSKQVPVVYAFFTQGILLIIFFREHKNVYFYQYIFLYIFTIFLIFFAFLYLLKIDVYLFIKEYIFYPSTIGSDRFFLFEKSFEKFFNQYKFLIIPLLISIFLKIKLISNKSNNNKNNIFKYLILISFVTTLILHQLLTKNQIFIYFLIPLIFGILDKDLELFFNKKKNLVSIILILILALITFKYHVRYNEERKFHELSRINLDEAIDAKYIHESLTGLKWINPFFNGNPKDEIELIKEGISQIEKEDDELMLITHYLFFDSITKKNMNMPSKTFTTDGISFPVKGSKYFLLYNSFLKNHLSKKKIKKVYFFNHENLSQKIISNNISNNCYKEKKDKLFTILEINCFN